jgi:hypothetical protein
MAIKVNDLLELRSLDEEEARLVRGAIGSLLAPPDLLVPATASYKSMENRRTTNT